MHQTKIMKKSQENFRIAYHPTNLLCMKIENMHGASDCSSSSNGNGGADSATFDTFKTDTFEKSNHV